MSKYTPEQVEIFKKLWFVYGNGGRKSTLFNHKLIQGFIEAGEDRREAYIRGRTNGRAHMLKNSKNIHVTDECLKVVGLVLENKFTEVEDIAKS